MSNFLIYPINNYNSWVSIQRFIIEKLILATIQTSFWSYLFDQIQNYNFYELA